MTSGDRQLTPDFQAELTGAAEFLGMPVLAVEKDYWVTRALRGMAAAHPDGFIFKGGTSITKGWRIGHRFSEDIDILVLERPEPDSVNGRDRILKAICEAGASACGAQAERLQGGKGEHRTVSVAYPAYFASDQTLLDHILLELGYSGGPTPTEVQTLTPLVAEALIAVDVDVSDNPDLQPFGVTCLHPGRPVASPRRTLSTRPARIVMFCKVPTQRASMRSTTDPQRICRVGMRSRVAPTTLPSCSELSSCGYVPATASGARRHAPRRYRHPDWCVTNLHVRTPMAFPACTA